MSFAANIRASLTVKYSYSKSSWVTYAPNFAKDSEFSTTRSFRRHSPLNYALLEDLILPQRVFKSVVLPAPDAPMM